MDQMRTRKRSIESSSRERSPVSSDDEAELSTTVNFAAVSRSSPAAQRLANQRKQLISHIAQSFALTNAPPTSTSDYYKLVRMIGKGAFGKVVLGVHKLTGTEVAIKLIDKECIRRSEHNKRKVF
jgi:hypothetical protein